MIVPLLVLMLSGPGVIGKGSGLYSDCKAFIATIEETGRKDYEEMFDAGRCVGYVKGISEGVKALHRACFDSATTNATLIRVYLAYMDKNPKLFDESETVGLSYALYEAYPCAAK